MALYDPKDIENLRERARLFNRGPKQRIPESLVDIDFKILKDAVNALSLPNATDLQNTDDFRRIDVDTKLDKNDLSKESRGIIYSSLIYSDEVEKFIRDRALHLGQRHFPEQLTCCFKNLYAEFYNNGIRGDELFDCLVVALMDKISRERARKAVYAILAHLFEICEVFEK